MTVELRLSKSQFFDQNRSFSPENFLMINGRRKSLQSQMTNPGWVRGRRRGEDEAGNVIWETECPICGLKLTNHRSLTKHRAHCRGPVENQESLTTFFPPTIVVSTPSQLQHEIGPDLPQHPSPMDLRSHLQRPVRSSPFDNSHTVQRPARSPSDKERIFYRWLCRSGTSLHSVSSDEWIALIEQVKDDSIPTDPKEVRSGLIAFAEYISAQIIYDLRFRNISILTDGGTWADRHWYFVVGFTPSGLNLIDVIHLEIADSHSVASAVGAVVTKLKNEAYIEVISICSDNAQNLVHAFNPYEAENSIFSVTGQRICHVRCTIHTINLALSDLGKEGGKEDSVRKGFMEFKKDIYAIMTYLRGAGKTLLRHRKITEKVPLIQEIKWNTWSIACDFIANHRGDVCAIIAQQHTLKWCSAYDQIASVLHLLRLFVEGTEKDCVTLADMFANYLRLMEELDKLSDNPYAKRFKMYVDGRFHTTGDLVLAELAFIFTCQGFEWMKKRRSIFAFSEGDLHGARKEQEALVFETNELALKLEDVCCLVLKLPVTVSHAKGTPVQHQNSCGHYLKFWLDAYLQSEGPPPYRFLREWWREFSLGLDRRTTPNPEKEQAREWFAETALRVSQFPATEAVCERIISVMDHIPLFATEVR
jgi:hypothetical protein